MGLRIASKLDEQTETLIYNVIGAAIEVHRELGPGYLEKVYEKAMSLELTHRKLEHATQVPVAVYYKGEKISGEVMDIVVRGRVLIELKSVESILPIHEAQVLSYLKSTGAPAALLINFKEVILKKGIKRFIQSPRD